jgi:hypothetical protein
MSTHRFDSLYRCCISKESVDDAVARGSQRDRALLQRVQGGGVISYFDLAASSLNVARVMPPRLAMRSSL